MLGLLYLWSCGGGGGGVEGEINKGRVEGCCRVGEGKKRQVFCVVFFCFHVVFSSMRGSVLLEAFRDTAPFDSLCSVFTAATLPPLVHNATRSKHTHTEATRKSERQGRAILPQIIRKKKFN